ncbi:hypothetical protein RN001_015500 [Aquatica leii]|uniref:Protease inhibitor n=1 Tax=Aquatica leii TaxID=1421715 RepID=A0AAN7P3H7_9COLE|nr:hypothetical protein RN001_015500 [Aquatica leii]
MKLVTLVCLTIILIGIHTAKADFQCSNDTTYTENGCNECSCNSRIGVVCSTKKLIENCQNYHQLRHCKVGTTSKKDKCNNCWSVEDIGTVCSNKKCSL